MADEPDNIVLHYLRRMDGRLANLEEDMQEVKRLLSRLEEGQSAIRRWLGRLEEPILRIEKRLDLVESDGI